MYAYGIGRILVEFIFWGWFREIRVLGKANMPFRRPVIITHCNMILDPLVVGVSVPYRRQVHFWAKNSLFANPIAAYMLRAFGAVPVDRSSKNNDELFRGTLECLKGNNVIAIFPEGTSYTLPHMMELKSGVSWAALEHVKSRVHELKGSSKAYEDMDSYEMRLATVVPVGITYLSKQKWRSVVIVHYGSPIELLPYLDDYENDPRSTVKRLTSDITDAMKSLTINAPDW